MAGKIAGTVLALMFLTFMTFLIAFYFLHATLRENINDINYGVSETISTSGEFTGSLYDYLRESVGKFGNYFIKLKLEKQIKPGIYDTYFENGEILDKKLRVGDRVTIYLEAREMTLFGRLINAAFMGHKPEKFIDTNIKSIKTAVISKSARNLVKGYDVITEIKACPSDSSVAIFVSTRLNPQGIYYGIDSHPDVQITNSAYGDSSDEIGNTGINYIFDNGDFTREIVKYDSGAIRLIKFIQQ